MAAANSGLTDPLPRRSRRCPPASRFSLAAAALLAFQPRSFSAPGNRHYRFLRPGSPSLSLSAFPSSSPLLAFSPIAAAFSIARCPPRPSSPSAFSPGYPPLPARLSSRLLARRRPAAAAASRHIVCRRPLLRPALLRSSLASSSRLLAIGQPPPPPLSAVRLPLSARHAVRPRSSVCPSLPSSLPSPPLRPLARRHAALAVCACCPSAITTLSAITVITVIITVRLARHYRHCPPAAAARRSPLAFRRSPSPLARLSPLSAFFATFFIVIGSPFVSFRFFPLFRFRHFSLSAQCSALCPFALVDRSPRPVPGPWGRVVIRPPRPRSCISPEEDSASCIGLVPGSPP